VSKYKALILEIIQSSSGHITAEEIFLIAKRLQPSIAIGTVYRNLGLMTIAGEIKRIVIPDSPDIFEIFTQQHEHLICQNCQKISDISVHNLKEYLKKQTGLEITGFDLNLRYICNTCKTAIKQARKSSIT
jgi:Fe2+ or Zn2+ uptake regulation protein